MMEAGLAVGLAFATMFVLVLMGVPICFALFGGAAIGLYLVSGASAVFGIFTITPYDTMANYPLAVAPLFILLGELAGEIGLSKSAYSALHKWVGKLPGGVLVATIGASALFGAVSGSTAASAALFSTVALPETRRLGYSDQLSLGSIAAAGTLATIIPPSIFIVFYGIVTGTPIGKVLIAGIIPGIIISILFSIYLAVTAKIRPDLLPKSIIAVSWRERFSSLIKVWPIIVTFVVIMGSMYTGIATPTEAGAVGAGFMLIYALATRITLVGLRNALQNSLALIGSIFIIIVAGIMLSKVVALGGLTEMLMNFLTTSGWGLPQVMGIVVVVLFILGCILDSLSMLILTMPIAFPLVTALGFDPVAFGILVVIMNQVAVLTPPVGINCFIVAAAAGVDSWVVFKGVAPFVVILMVTVLIFFLLPGIVLWLPNLAFSS